MANSSLIMTVKKDIINAICNDSDIVSIIDSPNYKGEDLKNAHFEDALDILNTYFKED